MQIKSVIFLAMVVAVFGQLPKSLPNLLTLYFSSIPGNYFYFCRTNDAVATWKQLNTPKINVNVRILTSNPSEVDFDARLGQPQRMGVFLDLSCEEGYAFLNQSLTKFNSTYRWMIWTEDLPRTTVALQPSRLEADSDAVALLPTNNTIIGDTEMKHFRLVRLYRLHFKQTVNVIDKPIFESPEDDLVGKPNFHGYPFDTGLMMIDIKFNESNLVEPLLDRTYESGADMVRRYGLSLFLHLAEYYNYTMNYLLSNNWGEPYGNGSWSGMVGQVQRGEAEFGLAPAKYIAARYGLIDYVTSLQIVRTCFTFLQPTLFGTYKALFLPLDPDVWLFLGVCTLGSILAFRILVPYDKTANQNDGWGGATFLVIAAIANQGVPDTTYYLATRIVYLVVLMVSFFVGVYYNTAILNGLLLQAPNAIQNIEQLLQSDIRLAVQDNPYLRMEITYNDTYTSRARTKLFKQKPPYFFSIPDGVAAIRRGQFALYTEDEAIYKEIASTMSDAEVCSVSEVEKDKPFHVGSVARYNGPYKEIFNRAFNLMRERGIMERQRSYWLLSKPECHWRQDALSLGVEPMFLAYVCMVLGILFSLLLFFLERLNHRGTFLKIRDKIVGKHGIKKIK